VIFSSSLILVLTYSLYQTRETGREPPTGCPLKKKRTPSPGISSSQPYEVPHSSGNTARNDPSALNTPQTVATPPTSGNLHPLPHQPIISPTCPYRAVHTYDCTNQAEAHLVTCGGAGPRSRHERTHFAEVLTVCSLVPEPRSNYTWRGLPCTRTSPALDPQDQVGRQRHAAQLSASPGLHMRQMRAPRRRACHVRAPPSKHQGHCCARPHGKGGILARLHGAGR